ncbi:MAG TPA: VOC family protein [bacterium]
MEILGIDNIIFPVGEMKQAVEFYEKLGFKLKFRVDTLDVSVMAIGSESPNLLLKKESMFAVKIASDRIRLWVEVPDVQVAAKELKTHQIPLVTKPLQLPAGWVIEVTDPWGNIVGFADHVLQPQYGRIKKS